MHTAGPVVSRQKCAVAAVGVPDSGCSVSVGCNQPGSVRGHRCGTYLCGVARECALQSGVGGIGQGPKRGKCGPCGGVGAASSDLGLPVGVVGETEVQDPGLKACCADVGKQVGGLADAAGECLSMRGADTVQVSPGGVGAPVRKAVLDPPDVSGGSFRQASAIGCCQVCDEVVKGGSHR